MLDTENIFRFTRKVRKKITAGLGVGQKIFNLSLHRCGTQSAAAFCDELGFSAQHWPGAEFEQKCEGFLRDLDTAAVWKLYRPLVKTHNSFHDVPVPFLYEHILSEFPDALYMLIVRQPPAWVRSVREHTKGRELTILEKFQYWTMLKCRRDCLDHYTDEELGSGYSKFASDVAEAMAARHVIFNKFSLEAPDLAASIAEFCGITHYIPSFEKIDIVARDRKQPSNPVESG